MSLQPLLLTPPPPPRARALAVERCTKVSPLLDTFVCGECQAHTGTHRALTAPPPTHTHRGVGPDTAPAGPCAAGGITAPYTPTNTVPFLKLLLLPHPPAPVRCRYEAATFPLIGASS